MSALWIAHVKVTDAGRLRRICPARHRCHRRPSAACSWRAAGPTNSLKGPDRPRNVVARFPSLQAAHDCYNSPAYQEALSHARGAAERELVIVEEA